MTTGQVEAWASDPNQYVADEEEETFTARVSGELLLEELVTVGVRLGVVGVEASEQLGRAEAFDSRASLGSCYWRGWSQWV